MENFSFRWLFGCFGFFFHFLLYLFHSEFFCFRFWFQRNLKNVRGNVCNWVLGGSSLASIFFSLIQERSTSTWKELINLSNDTDVIRCPPRDKCWIPFKCHLVCANKLFFLLSFLFANWPRMHNVFYFWISLPSSAKQNS